jgi:hypothetical protein
MPIPRPIHPPDQIVALVEVVHQAGRHRLVLARSPEIFRELHKNISSAVGVGVHSAWRWPVQDSTNGE